MTEQKPKAKPDSSGRAKVIVPIVVIILIVAGVGIYFGIIQPRTSNAQTGSQLTEIKIGTLHASSGAFADSSGFQYAGLNYWINQTNANGGLYLSSIGKSLPVKLYSYNDQSSTTTAQTDYANLITKDHVQILVPDYGSTLTSPGEPIAQAHHIVMWAVSASTPSFYTANNPYMVDLSIRSSALWPVPLANYIANNSANFSRVAILYLNQDFPTAQAHTTYSILSNATGVNVVYNKVTSDSSTAQYQSTLQAINATHPSAVLDFGYVDNDIAFYDALNANNMHFNFTFSIYPGLEFSTVNSSIPHDALKNAWSYGAPPVSQYSNVNLGPTTAQFTANWTSAGHSEPNSAVIQGYNTGLLLGKIITQTGSLNELAMRSTASNLSGNITTLDGPYVINTTTGAQTGEPFSVVQYHLNSTGALNPVVIAPAKLATGNAIYPAATGQASSGNSVQSPVQLNDKVSPDILTVTQIMDISSQFVLPGKLL